jgi:4'-phosphopantetheinyl transferase
MAPVSLHLADCDAWRAAVFVATLSADEAARANRFRHAVDRDRFVVRRGLLRRLLAEGLGIDPARVPLEPGPAGKPSLSTAGLWRAGASSTDGPPAFNLARSGGLALFAFLASQGSRAITGPAAPDGPVLGVDLERIDTDRRTLADLRRIADHFAPEETTLLQSLPDAAATDVFYRLWTSKEACLKCLGTGIGGGGPTLADIVVDMTDDGEIRSAVCHDGAHAWRLHGFTPCPGHVAAVAVAAGEARPRIDARLEVDLRFLEPSPAERAVSRAAARPPERGPGAP